MKNTDFRIGNLLIDSKGRLCKVESLDVKQERYGGDIHAPAIRGGITSLPVKPIELTPEIMKRLGFKHEGKDYRIEFKGCIYIAFWSRIKSEIHALGIKFDNETNNFTWHIKYVHQLQNLYFALTGEELIYTQAGGVYKLNN